MNAFFRLCGAGLALVALLSCGEPVLGLRRAVQAEGPEALLPGQRAALGCDPCVRLPAHPEASSSPGLVGPARAELALWPRDLLRVELRESPALTRQAVVFNVVLATHARVQPALVELRERARGVRVASSFAGRAFALAPTAIWPEYVFVARFRSLEDAQQFAQRFGVDVVFVPHGE